MNNTEETIYICKGCFNNVNVQNEAQQNLLENLPFIDENILDDIFGLDDPSENSTESEEVEEELDYEIFKKRGLHFVHINANSILSKLEEVKIIAYKSKAAVIGISESKSGSRPLRCFYYSF